MIISTAVITDSDASSLVQNSIYGLFPIERLKGSGYRLLRRDSRFNYEDYLTHVLREYHGFIRQQ